jgi:hypothetical protein
MNRQLGFVPEGLARSQLAKLTELSELAAGIEPAVLVARARQHLQRAYDAHRHNRFINVRLAEAICQVIEQVTGRWIH